MTPILADPSSLRPIPRPFFHDPGAEHALIDILPAGAPAATSVQWIVTDPLRFTPDLIRAIDTVIRRIPLAESPVEGAPEAGAACLRLLISITYRAGSYDVEPALARLQGVDLPLVTSRIDRLVNRLGCLLRHAGEGRARVLHGRN